MNKKNIAFMRKNVTCDFCSRNVPVNETKVDIDGKKKCVSCDQQNDQDPMEWLNDLYISTD